MTQTLAQIMERTQWFHQARFGMFLHWGRYSLPARGGGDLVGDFLEAARA